MPRVVSFIVLLAVIILIGSMFFQVMVQFIVPLFLAAVLVVIFKPLHLWVGKKCGDRVKVSAALTTLLIVLIVLLPIGGMIIRAVSEGAELYSAFSEPPEEAPPTAPAGTPSQGRHGSVQPSNLQTLGPTQGEPTTADTTEEAAQPDKDADKDPDADPDTVPDADPDADPEAVPDVDPDAEATEKQPDKPEKLMVDANSLHIVIDKLVPKINELSARFNLPALDPGEVRGYVNETMSKAAAPLALGGVRVLGSMLIGLAIMVLTLYYFFADGPNMVVGLMKLSPLDDKYEQELLDKFADISRSVVVAVLLSAVVQGLLAGVGYFFAGVHNVFFLTVLTCFLAMVPFIGAAAVWVFVCLYLFYVGSTTAAIVLAIYCMTVVSMIDNLIKPIVLHGQANLHPLLALLSVIGGIQTLGPIGILVGPMLVAFLQALLNMLNKELHLLGQQSDETGKPVVFATSAVASGEENPPAALPQPAPTGKRKRKKRK